MYPWIQVCRFKKCVGISHLSGVIILGDRRVRRVTQIRGSFCSRKRVLFVERTCWQRRLLLLRLASSILEHRQKQWVKAGLAVFCPSAGRLQQHRLASPLISKQRCRSACQCCTSSIYLMLFASRTDT